MGRVSRDARLLFVQLWTLCDDEGRTRAPSRMLASLLFPYDDDAPKLIDKWLSELEREKCIVRYQIEGQTYLEVCNWLNHQKIDKPSKSKIQPFDEASITLSNVRECSSLDQGSRIKDQGVDQGKDQDVSLAAQRESIVRVFDFWRETMQTTRSVLDEKRRKLIQSRLKDGYSADDLCKAIDGCNKSPFHMGLNDKGTKYNGIDLILRSAEHIDKFIGFSDNPPRPMGKQAHVEAINRMAGDEFLNDTRGIFDPTTIDGEATHV